MLCRLESLFIFGPLFWLTIVVDLNAFDTELGTALEKIGHSWPAIP
jgi:hypothetical protein